MTREFSSESTRDWLAELESAGWKRISLSVFKSPYGTFHRGPYGAWRAMQSIEQWGLKRCVDCGEYGAVEIQHKSNCVKGDLAVEILKAGILP